MYTKFGPEAKDGDYVIVLDADYMHRRATTHIAKVYKNKAYTGVRMSTQKGYKYLHKTSAEIIISEALVSDEIKAKIDEDIRIHNTK